MLKKNNYVCLFPWLENIHAIKCTGQIVNSIAERKNLNGYIVTFPNEDYNTFKQFCPNTNIIFLKRYIKNKRYDVFINSLFFIVLNAKKIDRLYLYHFAEDASVMPVIGLLYKLINKKGFLHVRLEAEPDLLPDYFPKIKGNKLITKIKSKIVESFYKHVDLVGSADNEQLTHLKTKYLWQMIGSRLQNQLNGYRFFEGTKAPPAFIDKKNYIILAGRLDDPQKGFDIFLEALKYVDLKDWQILLLGNISKFQMQQIDALNPNTREKIIIKGFVSNMSEYADYLNESKIFCLPSRNDGIPLVIPEAMARGCVLVSSDLFCVKEIIIDHEKYGFSFSNGNAQALADILNKLILQPEMVKAMSEKSSLRTQTLFHWNTIVDRLNLA